jgi:hypothetical protein
MGSFDLMPGEESQDKREEEIRKSFLDCMKSADWKDWRTWAQIVGFMVIPFIVSLFIYLYVIKITGPITDPESVLKIFLIIYLPVIGVFLTISEKVKKGEWYHKDFR